MATRHAKIFTNYWKLKYSPLQCPQQRCARGLAASTQPVVQSWTPARPGPPVRGQGPMAGGRWGQKGPGCLTGESLQGISYQGKYLVNFHAAGEAGAC